MTKPARATSRFLSFIPNSLYAVLWTTSCVCVYMCVSPAFMAHTHCCLRVTSTTWERVPVDLVEHGYTVGE